MLKLKCTYSVQNIPYDHDEIQAGLTYKPIIYLHIIVITLTRRFERDQPTRLNSTPTP